MLKENEVKILTILIEDLLNAQENLLCERCASFQDNDTIKMYEKEYKFAQCELNEYIKSLKEV